jgi:hypothetical protein
MGLTPTFPLTADPGTSVIPLLLRIAKVPALPRFTGSGPGLAALTLPHTTSSDAIDPIRRVVIVLPFSRLVIVVILFSLFI